MKTQEPQHRTDEQLIKVAAQGDKRAFTELVQRYEEIVYKFSYKVCRDKVAAEEALQDTFVNVYRKLDQFDGKSQFSTWLYRIVTNNCLMKRRRTKLDQVLESYDNPPADNDGSVARNTPVWDETPADLLMQKELKSLLDEAILKLPMDYRVVFVLRDVEGHSTEETASILGISQEAAKSRLRRARAFLRGELNTYVVSEDGDK